MAETSNPTVHASALLPFGHLQLSARAFHSCSDVGAITIEDVIRCIATAAISAESVGNKTDQEIRSAVRTYEQWTDSSGKTDWRNFWRERPISKPGVFITSTSLQLLTPEVRGAPLGALHLDKACSGLALINIATVGALIDAARAGIPKLRNFGAKARSEVVSALCALSCSVTEGIADWLAYAHQRGFTIIPPEAQTTVGSAFLTRAFPRACESVVRSQFDDRAWLVFSKRLLGSADEHETLEDIGKVYGVTREYIRQIEERCLDALRKPLLQGDYQGLTFRFRPHLIDQFRAAQEQFDLVALPAWTRTRWLRELSETWGIPSNEIRKRYRLLAEIFGYRAVRLENRLLDPLIVKQFSAPAEVRRLADAVSKLHDMLSAGDVADTFTIAKWLLKKDIQLSSVDEVPSLVELCSTAESIANRLFRLRFDSLRGRANQVVRVLSESGQPLHYRDIMREINRRLPAKKRIRSKRTLDNQIRTDSRIARIGKSGIWALTEWNLETRPLIDLIEDVLNTAGEAMHVDEITECVLQQRPGSEASILLLLQTHPTLFRKVAQHMYTLTAWGDSFTDAQWFDKNDTARFIESFFAKRDGKSVEFRELQEAFSAHTGLSPRSARGVLSHNPAVKVDRPDHHTRIASYESDWTQLPIRVKRRHAPLQTDIIVEGAKAKLIRVPTGERPLVEIVKELEAELGIRRENIYAAIKQSDDLETIAVEGSVFKICRIIGRSFASFPQLRDLRNDAWRSECERAVAKLNVDEVDVGLFLLGRQFDQAMRFLLEIARDHAGAAVSDGHFDSPPEPNRLGYQQRGVSRQGYPKPIKERTK